MKDLKLIKDLNLDAVTTGSVGRMIGFGAISLIAGFYCAEFCTAALLQVMGAASLAPLASSTQFIVGFSAVTLSWALWRLYRRQSACNDSSCLSARSMWVTVALLVTAFVLDVGF